MPDSMIAAISSVVPTGRRMKGSETFIAPLYRCASRRGCLLPGRRLILRTARTLAGRLTAAWHWARRCSRCSGRRSGLAAFAGNGDLEAVAQAVGAIGDNAVAGRQSGIDGGD